MSRATDTTSSDERRLLRIVKKARRGDAAAFDALIEMKGRDILYTCISLMKNKQDGEDVAQDVVLRIKKEIGKLEKPEAFGGWMYRVIYTTCMNARKKNSRLPALDEQAMMNAPLLEEREEFLPSKYVESSEGRAQLLAAIDQLPDKQRACILFFYYSDMSYIEIAEALETNEQDVANSLNRAKKKLKEILETEDDKKKAGFIPLKGAVAAPAIALALQQDAYASVTPDMLTRLSEAAAGFVVGGTAAAGIGSQIAQAFDKFALPAKIGSVAASVALVGVIGFAAYNLVGQTPEEALVQEYVQTNDEVKTPSKPDSSDDVIEEAPIVDTPAPVSSTTQNNAPQSSGGSTNPSTPSNPDPVIPDPPPGLEINSVNFPNDTFYRAVSDYDSDGNGYLSPAEIANITRLDLSGINDGNLTGVEHLTNLQHLTIANSSLATLDVSRNSALQTLSCPGINLTALNVTGCAQLTSLDCQNNKLTYLDVSGLGALYKLYCQNNSLTTLNMAGCTSITDFHACSNCMPSLDMSGIPDGQLTQSCQFAQTVDVPMHATDQGYVSLNTYSFNTAPTLPSDQFSYNASDQRFYATQAVVFGSNAITSSFIAPTGYTGPTNTTMQITLSFRLMQLVRVDG